MFFTHLFVLHDRCLVCRQLLISLLFVVHDIVLSFQNSVDILETLVEFVCSVLPIKLGRGNKFSACCLSAIRACFFTMFLCSTGESLETTTCLKTVVGFRQFLVVYWCRDSSLWCQSNIIEIKCLS